MSDTVHVIGAGIVGMCTALYLQREGFEVTVVDGRGPGEGASGGNAGSLGIASIPPASLPGVIRRVPRMLLDPQAPLIIRWRELPRLLPWFARFVRNAAPGRVERIADARARLLERVFDAYAPLLADAGAENLVRRTGKLLAFEHADGPARNRYTLEMRRSRGVRMEILDGAEVRRMEPALGPVARAGVYFPDVQYVADPLRLVQTFAARFQSLGGRLLNETVTGIETAAGGTGAILTTAGRHPVGRLVLAAGPWSRRLARMVGYRVPMATPFGYHTMLVDTEVQPRLPVMSDDRSIAVTPMEGAVRITGIAEFAAVDAPPDWRRADIALGHVRILMPDLGGTVASRWQGARPSTPDSLPVIGRSPRMANVFFAFGHDSLGLTMGAVTGRLIAAEVAGRAPEIDLTPYRPGRF
ncbi:MAG: FAD-dependent oxidoreductase [Rhodospirillales bacterium]|jgi:D-amino-acid dehydrogenase|nr:FAD-dependent oxidoreductase [Rhodospirillales bacterium]MDP6883528.1 FAD-dependent oxidoreductase [Rhodospirillales bacterium]